MIWHLLYIASWLLSHTYLPGSRVSRFDQVDTEDTVFFNKLICSYLFQQNALGLWYSFRIKVTERLRLTDRRASRRSLSRTRLGQKRDPNWKFNSRIMNSFCSELSFVLHSYIASHQLIEYLHIQFININFHPILLLIQKESFFWTCNNIKLQVASCN